MSIEQSQQTPTNKNPKEPRSSLLEDKDFEHDNENDEENADENEKDDSKESVEAKEGENLKEKDKSKERSKTKDRKKDKNKEKDSEKKISENDLTLQEMLKEDLKNFSEKLGNQNFMIDPDIF